MLVMLMTATMTPRSAFGQTVYTTAEIAAILRVSEESVRREIRRGVLGAARIGSQYRVTTRDLSDWLGASHYHDLFSPLGPLSEIIGTGTLEEHAASETASRLVAKARAERPAPSRTNRVAPSPDEVRQRREARQQSERQLKPQ